MAERYFSHKKDGVRITQEDFDLVHKGSINRYTASKSGYGPKNKRAAFSHAMDISQGGNLAA